MHLLGLGSHFLHLTCKSASSSGVVRVTLAPRCFHCTWEGGSGRSIPVSPKGCLSWLCLAHRAALQEIPVWPWLASPASWHMRSTLCTGKPRVSAPCADDKKGAAPAHLPWHWQGISQTRHETLLHRSIKKWIRILSQPETCFKGVYAPQPLPPNLLKEMSDFFTAAQYRSGEMSYGASAEQRVALKKRGEQQGPK